MNLSKSDYMLCMRHPAWLWIKKYQKELLPPIDANQQAIFDRGNRIEQYAEQIFAPGVHLGFNGFQEYQSLSQRTREALHQGATTIFQARFDCDGLTCITDVLEIKSGKSVWLTEIKSSTKPKEEHYLDLAFQVHVLTLLGYMVEKAQVCHINTNYVLDGDLDPSQLFTVIDCSDQVFALKEKTSSWIEIARSVLERTTMPDPSPKHCRLNAHHDWLPIYEKIVGTLPVAFTFPSLTPPQFAELASLSLGTLSEMPALESFTTRQKSFWQTLQEGARFDREGVAAFLDSLVYPLYFLDYETASDAVPIYQGTKPYQQVCFQYSVHVIREPGGAIEHFEYIHQDTSHPVPELSRQLQSVIGEIGSVLVWYADFEGSRNKEMGDMYPEFAPFYTSLNERMVDLMIPFSSGLVTNPAFQGSSSIKKVLPVLVPDLSYKSLVIQEGETAQRAWMETTLYGGGTAASRAELYSNLLRYCELDTLAMVKIWEWLKGQVE